MRVKRAIRELKSIEAEYKNTPALKSGLNIANIVHDCANIIEHLIKNAEADKKDKHRLLIELCGERRRAKAAIACIPRECCYCKKFVTNPYGSMHVRHMCKGEPKNGHKCWEWNDPILDEQAEGEHEDE